MGTERSNLMDRLNLPFVGRVREQRRLRQLHARRRHVLLIGAAGVGKSALIAQLREPLKLAVCGACDTLRHVCAELETSLGLPPVKLDLRSRKQRVRQALGESGRTVVFDGVGHATPRLSAFLESAMEHGPVWIATRSDQARDMGRFWPLLVRFERVELHPFHLADTRALIEAAVARGLISRAAPDLARWLHHRARGDLHRLSRWLAALTHCPHDLSTPGGRRLLELDVSLGELDAALAAQHHPSSS